MTASSAASPEANDLARVGSPPADSTAASASSSAVRVGLPDRLYSYPTPRPVRSPPTPSWA